MAEDRRFGAGARTITSPSLLLAMTVTLWLGPAGGASAVGAQQTGEEVGDPSQAVIGASWVASRYILQVGADSGLGVAFVPEPSYLETMATTFGLEPVPGGVVLLEAVLDDGDPARAAGGTWVRPDDMSVTPALQAGAILAEVTAASALAQGASDPATAFQARLLLAAATAKADFAVARMMGDDDRFYPVRISAGSVERDPEVAPLVDQLLMVEALARVDFALGPDNGFKPWFLGPAAAILDGIEGSEVVGIGERAQAIIADAAFRGAAGGELGRLATRFRADLRPAVLNRTVDRMWALRAIALSGTDVESIRPAHTVGMLVVADVLNWLDGEDPALVTTTDLSLALAALKEWRQVADEADRLTIDLVLNRLLDEVIGRSGIVRSSLRPYSWVEGDQSELLPPPAWVQDNITAVETPPMITDSVERTATGWRSGGGFNPASAYALATALVMWEPGALVAPVATGGGSETTLDVEAFDFSFSPGRLEVEAGSQLTIRLTNRGVVPHNLAIPALGVLVEAGPGGNATTVVDLPAEITAYDFLCSLPGHYESGMRGTMAAGDGASSSPTVTTSAGEALAAPTTAPAVNTQESGVTSPAQAAAPASESVGSKYGPEVLVLGGLAAAVLAGWRGRRSSRARAAAVPR